MPADTTKTKGDLDKSIDLGMDQFGRFLKRGWFWILAVIFLILFFTSTIHIGGLNPGTVLVYVLQIGFAVLFGIMQFVAIIFVPGTTSSLLGHAGRNWRKLR